MHILIRNCFHWLGYHLVTKFLNNGYGVDGIHHEMSHKEQFLSHYFGRNDLFTVVDEPSKEYDLMIMIDDKAPAYVEDQKNMIYLFFEQAKDEHLFESSLLIKLPLLFGEWMEMDEKGFFQANEYISFASDYFKNNAFYVEDFVTEFLGMIKDFEKSSDQELSLDKDLILDNLRDLRNNRSIENKIKQVRAHCKKTKHFYGFLW